MEVFQLSILENLNLSYQSYLTELRNDSMSDDDTSLLSEDFIHDFKKIINEQSLDHYAPKKFYWLNLIDQLVDTIDVTEGMLEGDLALEDAVDFLEGSEFLGLFLESDSDPEQNLKNIIEIQELQIISYYWLHINETSSWEPEGPVAYRPIPEMGEGHGKLYLSDNNHSYIYPSDLFQDVLPIVAYHPQTGTLVLDNEGEIIECKKQENNVLCFQYDSKKIDIVGELIHENKIHKAFSTIEKCHPQLYKLLFTFSHVIIPVNEEGIVSYSMDTLPGFSCINTFHRDFVDLLDDLIHENGHHYLNAMIEGKDDLITEDDDKIFYSPWRRALRPIRGLYHAVATFYWAFELFKELRDHSHVFNKDENIKIHRRFTEEAFMILNCRDQIAKAYELKKITLFGLNLINSFIKRVEDFENEVQNSEAFIKNESEKLYSELISFKETIIKAQSSFK